ncbi:MAG: hypothetical protein P8O23_11190 [Opitutales bacterium]|nr:hypothetical protein [Opitutales bacterium]
MSRNFNFLLLLSLITSGLFQANRATAQGDIRPGTIDDIRNRQYIRNSRTLGTAPSVGIGQSDLGIQRPVEAKNTGFGYHLGFETKLYYTNNPASVDSGMLKEASGVWENALRNHFLLGAFDLGGATFSPMVSLNYTKFTHFGDELFDSFDFDSLGLNFAGVFQIGQGWTIRPNLGLSFDLNPKEGLERQYHQISPSIALGRQFKIGKAQSFIEWTLAKNFTDSAYVEVGVPVDKLDRFETALIWGVNIPFHNFEFSPFIRFGYTNYSNQDRDDFLTNLGLELKYSFSNWFYLKAFANFSSRQSDADTYDFNRLDSGMGAALNAKF